VSGAAEAATWGAARPALASRGASAALVRVVLLALIVRAAVFPFADNKHSDAPMRALIAEHIAQDPAAGTNPRTYCQFGPLHMMLMAPFVALDHDLRRSSRELSLLAGMLTFLPFMRLARRLVGEAPAELAGIGLAASPLHVQASTTAASEALYLLLFVAMLDRLVRCLDDDAAPLGGYAVAGALASLGAVTRYDAWIALPATLAAAWLFARGPAGPARKKRACGLALFAVTAALLPAAWVVWSALRTDDALFFFHYISKDHAQLAATALSRFGAVLGRARQIGIWALAFTASMTPWLAFVALRSSRAIAARASGSARVVLVAALAPIALYLAQGLGRLSFEPLPRFAIVPGALLLPFAAAFVARERLAAARVLVPALGAGFAFAAFVIACAGHPRIWGGAESMGALTRLDGEDRALAAHLRAHRAPHERVMIEPFAFNEIGIAAAAGVPHVDAVMLTVTREPAATLAETTRETGARWVAAYDDDRPERWTRRLPDWPHDGQQLELGRWRLVHR
jgi:4-amino-4-deoxy-L-arabinose transferase-like glycosyltransferase